jgi:hypothetical protein
MRTMWPPYRRPIQSLGAIGGSVHKVPHEGMRGGALGRTRNTQCRIVSVEMNMLTFGKRFSVGQLVVEASFALSPPVR